MSTISLPNTFTAGTVILSAQVNSNFTTIYNDYNGNITNANISGSAAIADTKLATISTAGKVNISALTVASQAQGDVIYASSASAWARLGAGTAGQALTTGGASANPAWAGMTTQGDVEYHNGTTRTRLAAGTAGQALTTAGAGANPAYAGMTTQGDIEYFDGTVRQRLAKNASATRVLTNTGTSNNPAWAQVTLTNGVTGVLPEANGGTNQSTYAQGDTIYASAANTLAKLTVGSSGQSIVSNGTVPAWQTVIATQAEMESASSVTVYATPGRVQFHPGVAKFWVMFNGTGTPAVTVSHNVDSSITDNGTGDYTISITTDFSSANWAPFGWAGTTRGYTYLNTATGAGTIRINCTDNNGASLIDQTNVYIVGFGDQA